MRIFRHQDFFLIAAFAAAIVVIFSSSIQRMLDYVRGVEQETGLTLLPALVMLVGGFVFHQIRRNQQQQAKAEAAELATKEAQHRAEELERLVTFGQTLGRALDFDSIRMSISQHLPTLTRSDNVWVLVQQDADWLALHADIDAELRRARRNQMPVTVIMFDLDHFKDVNDRYGHLCGDAVLSAVGKRMKEVLRGSDLKCRWGGEEFLVLLPETPLHGARRVADTLRREIADRPIPWAGEGLTMTASFGVAQTLPGEVNVEAVIARADQALYRAKDDGRNCVRIAPEAVTLVADNRVS
jgi:diguanylate cyclase (GGDEF)-like protein